MKYYVAYGSNLSVEQMAFRCPDAVIAGTATLEGWKIAFGAHATIEPCDGAECPVLIWQISDEDERSLDRYEGYPKYYYKRDLLVDLMDMDGNFRETVSAMVYIMTEIQKSGTPSGVYYNTIAEGYERFGFDLEPLKAALYECMSGNMEVEK